MSRFFIDENLPFSLATALQSVGHDAVHLRTAGLQGEPDTVVTAYARSENRILITGDVGIGNIRNHPPGTHPGIVLARLSTRIPMRRQIERIVQAIASFDDDALNGALIIIELHRIRRRGP